MQESYLRLWRKRANEPLPNARGESEADCPTLTVHLPSASTLPGAAVMFPPGGGYSMIYYNTKRQGIVAWLASPEVTVFVLRYRHGGSGYLYPAPFFDAARALRWVRHYARDYNLDPSRVGVKGASAGGHLAALVETRFDQGNDAAADVIDRESSRPDFAVLLYPVVSLTDPLLTHAGSRKHLVGEGPNSDARARELSAETVVPPTTPPTFIVYGGDDTTTPPANGAILYLALKHAGIKTEAHFFETGPHAFGVPPKIRCWPRGKGLLDSWLIRHGVFR